MSIYKQIAKQFDMDERVIKLICEHPLFFVKQKIEDPENIKAIMIRYFCKFVPKYNKTIEDKKFNVQKYLSRKAIAIEKMKQKKSSNNIDNTTLI